MKTNLRNLHRVGIFVTALMLLALPLTQAQQVDRSKPPQLGTPPSLTLPQIQKSTLSNGIRVVIMEKHGVPVVQMNLLIRAGAALEPQDKIGLASLTAAMLKEGAGDKSSLELADAIDYLGASIGTSADNQSTWTFLHTPLSKFDQAFSLFADIVLKPTFPADELERLRKERLTSLVQRYDQPTMVAAVAASQFVFGEKHPYGRGAMGTEKTIRGLTIEDLKGFYNQYYHAGNAVFIVIGDVRSADVVVKLEKTFGTWRKGEPAILKILAADQVRGRTVYLIDKPNAPQSVIRISRVGVDRLTKDYFPLTVMNTILGGSFSSRLNNNLREQHGYTYGAGSSFDMRLAPGSFTASSSVQTAVTDKAMTEFFNELNRISEKVSDQELTRAKNYLALGYPGDFETVSQIAGQLGEILYYGLPDDYFNNYIGKVLAVTKEDVQRVAKKYIDPENIAVVVVGDQKSVQKGLEGLKLGKLKTMKIEDVLGKMPVL
jgi:predicted Zn-dependent peptidase